MQWALSLHCCTTLLHGMPLRAEVHHVRLPRQPCHLSSILNAICCRASTLAEFGTHQLEFWRLSQRTGNATYAQLAEATIRHLNKLAPNQVRG